MPDKTIQNLCECQRKPSHDKGGSSLATVSNKEGLEGKVFLHTLGGMHPKTMRVSEKHGMLLASLRES